MSAFTVKRQMHLGKSFVFADGAMTVDEDLLLDGKFTGTKIDAGDKSVTIGIEAEVNADISGSVVQIIGTLNGNVYASEEVQVEATATVNGDLSAPKVALAKRCRFQGRITYI